jgi:DNA-binding NarL/FixJ family response regulator
LTRVAVILHERLGNWNRQLRPRLAELPVRWFETRSQADLLTAVIGRASPVVLVDLAHQPIPAVSALDQLLRLSSDARVLVLDPEGRKAEAALARELGATHVVSGFVPPPVVADLLARWIALAERDIKRSGWSQTSFPESQSDTWGWLDEYLQRA